MPKATLKDLGWYVARLAVAMAALGGHPLLPLLRPCPEWHDRGARATARGVCGLHHTQSHVAEVPCSLAGRPRLGPRRWHRRAGEHEARPLRPLLPRELLEGMARVLQQVAGAVHLHSRG